MDKCNVSVVILTLNEEANIEHCLKNVSGWAKQICILDSGSVDQTTRIAERYGVESFYRSFDNYSNQRNYALTDLPINSDWILFLDADEYLTLELKEEIRSEINNADIDGFYLKRRFIFLGRWIKHGGYYPVQLMRLFRYGKGRVEREINEQYVVEGKTKVLEHDFVDHNRNGLAAWIEKHNRYSTMEAHQLIAYEERREQGKRDDYGKFWGTSPQRKRWFREHIWNKFMSPFFRPFFYFFYRYFFRLGFLDGKPGFIFFFLHAFLMVFATAAKYYENKIESK